MFVDVFFNDLYIYGLYYLYENILFIHNDNFLNCYGLYYLENGELKWCFCLYFHHEK
jgi:hypothetical protein